MSVAVLLLLVQLSAPVPAAPCAGCSAGPDQAAAPATDVVTGTVRDSAGGVVSGAAIIVRVSGRDQQTLTGPDGRFTANVPAAADAAIIVRAAGFAEVRQTIAPGAGRLNVEIVVAPAAVMEAVTVTATRSERRTGDVPASVNLLSREDIKQSPAMVADDVLRQIPTFSLFRRTSSLASHPTTQGVSLRGIGPSGVSRTLVLLDGVPFNDPFGGWVVLVAGAARERRSDRGGRQLELQPVRELRDGRRHPLRDEPSRRAHVRAEIAVRHPQQPQAGLPRQPRVGQGGRRRRRERVQYRRVSNRAGERARRGRQQRGRAVLESQREGRLQPDGSSPGVLPRGLLRRGTRQRQETARSTAPRKRTTRRGDPSAEGCGPACRTRAICRRRSSRTSRHSTATFWRCPRPRPRGASAG